MRIRIAKAQLRRKKHFTQDADSALLEVAVQPDIAVKIMELELIFCTRMLHAEARALTERQQITTAD